MICAIAGKDHVRKADEIAPTEAYPWSEVLAFPLLHGGFGFEVAQIFEGETFVLAVQLLRALFAAMDDRVDVVVDHQAAESSV